MNAGARGTAALLNLAAIGCLLLAAPHAARATHDVGESYHLLRMADDGRALVAVCDLQGGEAPLAIKVVGRSGRTVKTLARSELRDVPVCGLGWEALAAARPELAAEAERLGLDVAPVPGPASPTRGRYVLRLPGAGWLDVEVIEAGVVARSRRVVAKLGFSDHTVDAQVAWHPEERAVVVYGAKVKGVVPSAQVWEPLFISWKLSPRRTVSAADRAARWIASGKTLARECPRDQAACDRARDAWRRALALVPEHPEATRLIADLPKK